MTERRIPIETSQGTFHVWTSSHGSNDRIKLLLLHGGPGGTSEYFEGLTEFLVAKGIEVIEYDQLGSFRSDQPTDDVLWELPRFVDELQQVCVALGLDASNCFLLGHSWGGLLTMEYTLAHGDRLKGIIVSNMMSSIPAYNRYAEEVFFPTMDQDVLRRIKAMEAAGETTDPEYEALLMEHHYVHHVLRQEPDQWPDAVVRSFAHMNQQVYVLMQGPSELGASGRLVEWDRFGDLGTIEVPALVISAEHDTMDPVHMREMSERMPRGELLHCPDGSHMAMWDDADAYATGVLEFLRGVDAARS